MTLRLWLGTAWGSAASTLPFPEGGMPTSPGPSKSYLTRSGNSDVFKFGRPGPLHAVKISSCEAANRKVVLEGSELNSR